MLDLSLFLGEACTIGAIDIIKLLLSDPRVDPSEPENYPLRICIQQQNFELFNLFMSDIRIDPSYPGKKREKFNGKEKKEREKIEKNFFLIRSRL